MSTHNNNNKKVNKKHLLLYLLISINDANFCREKERSRESKKKPIRVRINSVSHLSWLASLGRLLQKQTKYRYVLVGVSRGVARCFCSRSIVPHFSLDGSHLGAGSFTGRSTGL